MKGTLITVKRTSKNPFAGPLGLDEDDESKDDESKDEDMDEGSEESESMDDDVSPEEENAGQAALDAVQAGDAKAFAKAVCGLFELHEGGGGGGPPPRDMLKKLFGG